MIEIRKTEHFANWLDNLRDIQAKARVVVRIKRLASGNAGDVKPVGEGVSEMRSTVQVIEFISFNVAAN